MPVPAFIHGLGLLATVTRGDSSPTLYTERYKYDRAHNLIEFWDGRDKKTYYTYDAWDRQTAEKDMASPQHVTSYSYVGEQSCGCSGSGQGLVGTVTKPDGTAITMTYDLADRLKTIDYPGSPNPEVSYTYNKNGQVTSVTDQRLPFTNKYSYMTYDSLGRLSAEYHPEGYSKTYFYNATTGRLEAYKDEDGNITGYYYDGYGRLSTLADQEGGTTTYTYATTSDSSFPIGATKKIAYGNAASENYTFDILGRVTNISHKNASNSQFDYVGLTYNASGLITGKSRYYPGPYPAATTYTYDNALRLAGESYSMASTAYGYRTYQYDGSGNRTQLVHNVPSYYFTKTTTLTYNDLNQLTDHTGYNVIGTTDPGYFGGASNLPEFLYDANGNMTERRFDDSASGSNNDALDSGDTRWQYTWNADNRLTNVHRQAGVVLGGSTYDVGFSYDVAGRRILRTGIGASDSVRQRTRYFFQGLTEAVRKVSIGTHSDNAFTRSMLFDGESTPSGWYSPGVSKVSDSTRRSNVYQCSSWTYHGAGFWDSGNGENVTGKRTFSTWVKGSNTTSQFGLHVITSGGRRCLYYLGTTGSPYKSGTQQGFFPLGGTSQSFASGWTRLERDLQADLVVLWPGETLQTITGVDLGCGSSGTISIDDLAFSNSLTIEHDTLGPGSISHILRQRTINTSTYAATDTWYHYDQVGSVMAETNSSGALTTQRWQDAFGNSQPSFTAPVIGGTQAGFHHNTKEYDDDVDLVYMYQRWYLPETGEFLSKAPRLRHIEVPYGFAGQLPTGVSDAQGACPICVVIVAAILLEGCHFGDPDDGKMDFVVGKDGTDCDCNITMHERGSKDKPILYSVPEGEQSCREWAERQNKNRWKYPGVTLSKLQKLCQDCLDCRAKVPQKGTVTLAPPSK